MCVLGQWRSGGDRARGEMVLVGRTLWVVVVVAVLWGVETGGGGREKTRCGVSVSPDHVIRKKCTESCAH
jgi:hypothetical protein